MNEPLLSLDALGLKYATDKASNHHDYLVFYERFFAYLRDQPIRLLEIGVLRAASLLMWKEYFVNATIVGADINPATARFAEPRIGIEILDQSNLEQLVALGVRHGPFDIIIEDGSHQWEHQITTLRTLFPFVRPGGFYVVEDLQTNFGALAARYRGVASMSCVDYLKRLVDLRVADEQTDITQEEDAFLRTYGRAANYIAFYRHACLIEKAQLAQLPRLGPGEPLVADAPDEPSTKLTLVAHVGYEGDKTGQAGWIHCTVPGSNIQGFSIDGAPPVRADLSYRARLKSGVWTDWAGAGQFVGTRGERDDLTGFAVRLAGASRDRYEIEAIGEFRGETAAVPARGGGDCVATSGRAPLFRMQVVLRPRPARPGATLG